MKNFPTANARGVWIGSEGGIGNVSARRVFRDPTDYGLFLDIPEHADGERRRPVGRSEGYLKTRLAETFSRPPSDPIQPLGRSPSARAERLSKVGKSSRDRHPSTSERMSVRASQGRACMHACLREGVHAGTSARARANALTRTNGTCQYGPRQQCALPVTGSSGI